jgi:hypothetical protein
MTRRGRPRRRCAIRSGRLGSEPRRCDRAGRDGRPRRNLAFAADSRKSAINPEPTPGAGTKRQVLSTLATVRLTSGDTAADRCVILVPATRPKRLSSLQAMRCRIRVPRLRRTPLRHIPVIGNVLRPVRIVQRSPIRLRRFQLCRARPAILPSLGAPILIHRLADGRRMHGVIGMRRVPRCPVMSPRRRLASRHPRPLPPMPANLNLIIFVHQASPVSLSAQFCLIRRMIAELAASCRRRANSAGSDSCPPADIAPLSPRQTSSSPSVSGRPSPSPSAGRSPRLPISVRGTF